MGDTDTAARTLYASRDSFRMPLMSADVPGTLMIPWSGECWWIADGWMLVVTLAASGDMLRLGEK